LGSLKGRDIVKSELVEQLLERYPWIHPKKLEEGNLPNPWQLFGIECGDGWFQLLWNLFGEIEKKYKEKGRRVEIEISQIKEKYGTLNVYLWSDIPEIQHLVEKYETLSESVCEQCGAKGRLREVRDWLSTLCDRCFIPFTDSLALREKYDTLTINDVTIHTVKESYWIGDTSRRGIEIRVPHSQKEPERTAYLFIDITKMTGVVIKENEMTVTKKERGSGKIYRYVFLRKTNMSKYPENASG
jgi:hypothetical protein